MTSIQKRFATCGSFVDVCVSLESSGEISFFSVTSRGDGDRSFVSYDRRHDHFRVIIGNDQLGSFNVFADVSEGEIADVLCVESVMALLRIKIWSKDVAETHHSNIVLSGRAIDAATSALELAWGISSKSDTGHISIVQDFLDRIKCLERLSR